LRAPHETGEGRPRQCPPDGSARIYASQGFFKKLPENSPAVPPVHPPFTFAPYMICLSSESSGEDG